MYHPPSKRKQLLKLVAIYTVMSVAVLGLVTVLVFFMLGYRFDRQNGRIEQEGLVQFDSTPRGAEVTIDGQDFGSRTATKTTMTAGQHFITMKLKGYEQWQKSVDVVAGNILWLNYARLIPNELKPQDVARFAAVSSTAVSSNDRLFALIGDPATPVIHLSDISGDRVRTTTLTLPADSYTAPAAGANQSFRLMSWDSSSRYLLVKHTYGTSQTEWLRVDTEHADATKNVTRLLGVAIDKLVFSASDSDILYAQIGQDVRQINLSVATLSRPLITDVAEFALYGNSTLTYVTRIDPTTKTRSVGYYTDGASKARVVRSYNDDGTTPLHFAISKYYGDTYIEIAYGDVLEILKGDMPSSDATEPTSYNTVATVTVPGGADYLTAKTSGRFIVAQHKTTVTVYDLELQKLTTTILRGDGAVKQPVPWLDGYMFWSDLDGTVRFYEFDGANQHDIMTVTPGFDATLSENGKYFYAITKGAGGEFHLARVRLIV